MAQLIHELAVAGARDSSGAPLSTGRAWFFQPGTASSQAIVYGDSDGLAALSQPVALDAGGRATVYTKTACRVQLEDVNGVLVAVFDRGNTVQAAAVEVESPGFTGTVLSGSSEGSQGAGGRTDHGTVLSRIYSSLGGVDAQYQIVSTSGARVGGPRPLTTALSEIVINVKNFLCGDGLPVAGDGVHVDTSGIQAAVNYVSSVGGGILYFPPGTYLIDQVITLTNGNGVSIEGAGGKVSIIKNTNGVSGVFSMTSCSSFFIKELGITNSGTSIGAAYTFTSCSDVFLFRLYFDPSGTGTHATGILFAGTSGGCTNTFVDACSIKATPGSAGSRAIKYTASGGSSDGHSVMRNIISVGTLGTAIEVNSTVGNIFISSNRFTDSLATTGITLANVTAATVLGNKGLTNYTTPISVTAFFDLYQAGNGVDSQTTSLAGGGSYTPDLGKGNFIIIAANGATATLANPVVLPSTSGFVLYVEFKNTAGVAVTWSLGGQYRTTGVAIPTTDGHRIMMAFIYDSNASLFREMTRTDLPS